MSEYQVLARRYRPQTFAEVFGQEAIVTTLKNAIHYKRLAHAYLFCGSRGTGKTTLARVLAKALNCENRTKDHEPCNHCISCREITAGSSLDVLEIDGASHRGIDDIRQINETVGYSAASGGYKVYIIDEVHMLTKEAFNALLKTLEEPPKNVIFFFATTEPHKVPNTILSRCQRFNLNRIPLDKIVQKLTFIAQEQTIEISEEALHIIATRAEGGMRDAESVFDQIIAFHEGAITAESVADVLGIVPRDLFFKLDGAAKEGDLGAAFEITHQIFTQGKDLLHFVESLTEHFRTLLLVKIGNSTASFLSLLPADREKYTLSAKLYTQEQCLTVLEMLIEAIGQIRYSPSPRMALEGLLLKILRIHQRIPIDYLVRQLNELESALGKSLAATPSSATPPPLPKVETPVATPTPPPPATNHNPSATLTPKPSAPDPSPTVPEPTLSITIDPTPSPHDLGLKPVASTKQKPPAIEAPREALTEKTSKSAAPTPPLTPPPPTGSATPTAPLTQETQADNSKKQSRYDTLLQFAAVELEGSLHKTTTKGF